MKKWATFLRRTVSPKLDCILKMLERQSILYRRVEVGSFHGPIIEVREEDFDKAMLLLEAIDDVPDKHPIWKC